MSENIIVEKGPITDEYLSKMDAYFRAANYLSAAQLYLLENPLLRQPLTMEQVKKKIVGHWGTVPGQNRECRGISHKVTKVNGTTHAYPKK